MKLTKSKLKEIIREELLKEGMNIKEAAGSSFASNSRLQAMVQTLNNAISDFEKDYNETAQGNDYIKSNKKVIQLLPILLEVILVLLPVQPLGQRPV